VSVKSGSLKSLLFVVLVVLVVAVEKELKVVEKKVKGVATRMEQGRC
jgi:hypothetical protein